MEKGEEGVREARRSFSNLHYSISFGAFLAEFGGEEKVTVMFYLEVVEEGMLAVAFRAENEGKAKVFSDQIEKEKDGS